MPEIRVAAVSLNQTPLSWLGNAENVIGALREARAAGAQVVCLPELCLSGYGCEDAFLWADTREQAILVLEDVLPETAGLIVTVGLPLLVSEQVFNVALLLVDGKILGGAAKRHLAGDGLHYEPRWFAPWPKGRVEYVPLLGQDVPIGDVLFSVGGVRFAFEICEDAWVVERPAMELSGQGVDVLLNPSASHFAFGKHRVRRALVQAGAELTGGAYVYANLLGNEAGRAIYDGDALICSVAPDGARVVSETKRLSFQARQMAVATVSVLGAARGESEFGRPLITSGWAGWQPSPPKDSVTWSPTSPDGELPKEEAFSRVIALGLFDYLRKSRSRGFVVSLSGGVDSASVALLVRLMVRLGVSELGLAGFVGRLGASLTEEEGASEAALVRRLFVTAYQATENSSETTRHAAAAVAAELGSTHYEISVQGMVDGYRALAEASLGRELSWSQDDIALQNIQARVRAPFVWMLANISGALLLATSNRSEAAVGYATMDGDTAGGLSPIAGIDKAFLQQWLRHAEGVGSPELGPVRSLSLVNEQAPTAELRPLASAQTDETDLMPYPVLDAIERLAIVSRLSPAAVLARLVTDFPSHERGCLKLWLSRFYTLFARNQWKRERYAPSFHVDDANLDPKTWCRFPILSGGFSKELAELE